MPAECKEAASKLRQRFDQADKSFRQYMAELEDVDNMDDLQEAFEALITDDT